MHQGCRAPLGSPHRAAASLRRQYVRLSIGGLLAIGPPILSACSARDDDRGGAAQPAIQSIQTDLRASSCRREIDKSDPNETPYLVCPGVAGYSLIVRRVDAGRQSIDVVNSSQQAFPLNYQEFVTRHMFSLGTNAEWRVASKDGKQLPIALIVRIQAREDNDNPEQVTRTYWAVAKISANESCVTDRILEGARSETDVRIAADSAQGRSCAPAQPPITANEGVVR